MKLSLSLTGRRWRVRPAYEWHVQKLAAALAISPVTARLMVLRGLSDPREAALFWHDGAAAVYDPLDPACGMADLGAAVERIWTAIKGAEKITVYGDYDVDGVSATALLSEVLSSLGAAVDTYIPGRMDEGYGLNLTALQEIRGRGTRLVVTVDCGVSAVEEAAKSRELGLDLVITDHHRPGDELPVCCAVVNPRRADCRYPFKELAGVGVAYKVGQALLARAAKDGTAAPAAPDGSAGGAAGITAYLDLLALGTIADVVPLLGENRHLVRQGLEQLGRSSRLGIAALCTVAGFDLSRGGALDSNQVAFGLAPRLNAAGRMGSAETALGLLLARRKGEAAALASQLDAWNRERQATERRIMTEALAMTGAAENYTKSAVVLAGRGWHPGVIGIVASKLAEVFHRPVFLVALGGEEGVDGAGDEEGRGSARSVPWCDLYASLEAVSDTLVKFGGHHQAAGFTVLERHLAEFTARVEEVCAAAATEAGAKPGQAVAEADGWLVAGDLEEAVVREVQGLAPFGFGNPQPVFLVGPLQVSRVSPMGQGNKHLRIEAADGDGRRLETVAFGLGQCQDALRKSTAGVYLAINTQIDSWQGRERVQFVVRDIVPAESPAEAAAVASSDFGELAAQAAAAIGVEAGAGVSLTGVTLDTAAIIDVRRRPDRLDALGEAGRNAVLHVHPGFSLADLAVRSAGAEQVWLAFNEDTAAANEVFLGAVCPDRDFLVRLYRTLREKNKGGRPPEPADLVASLPGAVEAAPWASQAARARMQVGLRVLRDLGLLENGSLRLAPSPVAKLDLEASPTFRAAYRLARGYRNFASFVLEAPPEEVRQALVETSMNMMTSAGRGPV